MAIRCGTCAWADHHLFYPSTVRPQERLAYYADYFPLVEVDSSFYRIPELRHVENWVNQTPETFIFDIKVFRRLTLHDRNVGPPYEDVRDMQHAVSTLRRANKLGMVLFQFPPWFVQSAQHIEYLERVRQWFDSDTVAVEFRNRSWWADSDTMLETIDVLRRHRFVNVVCDEPQSGSGTIPFVPEVTNDAGVMFRLHGRNAETWYQSGLTSSQQRFDYLYSKEELSTFLPYVIQWSERAQSVHILMNNNQMDYAVSNAFDWLSLLNQEMKPRPPKPGQQLALFD